MKDKESIFFPGYKIKHISKLGYIRLSGPNGQDYYVSTEPPKNPAMYTDAYAFTKMCVYLECNKEDEDTVFECFYHRNPYNGGFALTMGLSNVVEYLKKLEINGTDIDYLKSVWSFPDKFWQYLREFKWEGILKAIPEGTVIEPFIPIYQIKSKLTVSDFIETRLLNLTGGPITVATKALRMTIANPDVPWIEMAARRASSYDSGMMIARYAYIGGAGKCIGTSLVSAGQKYGIPIKGTSSHSSVLAFNEQLESFRAQFDLFGSDAVLVLDTYGYIYGAQNVIQVAREMGVKSFSGRLDSGNLQFQSKVLREILDGNGFYNVRIIASNDIDEFIRKSLREQKAKNNCDSVGTSMNPPPLGIVYKPVVINGRNVIKINHPDKTTDPCEKNIYRLFNGDGKYEAYIATKNGEEPYLDTGIYYHRDRNKKGNFSHISAIEQTLVPILIDNHIMTHLPSDLEIQEKVALEAEKIPSEVKKFDDPSIIPFYLSECLWNTKQKIKQQFSNH